MTLLDDYVESHGNSTEFVDFTRKVWAALAAHAVTVLQALDPDTDNPKADPRVQREVRAARALLSSDNEQPAEAIARALLATVAIDVNSLDAVITGAVAANWSKMTFLIDLGLDPTA